MDSAPAVTAVESEEAMGDLLTGDFGRPHRRRQAWPKYEAQESEVITPPEKGPPLDDEEDTRVPYPPGAPPFTGEDVEDAGEPER
jgi:hypothetical protein